MSSRILFLDIDGPLIPGRAYQIAGQTSPFVKIFDPVAVSIINTSCEKQNRKIVLHSSWIRTKLNFPDDLGMDVKEWCIGQGIKEEFFHEDAYCDRDTSWRYDRVDKWLQDHPNTNDFVIVDDEPPANGYHYSRHVLLVDFEDGLLMKHWRKLLDGNWGNP